MVGFPARHCAMVEYSSLYIGPYLATASLVHCASILDQSSMVWVASSNGDPHGSSLSGMLLWAIPTMMASAWVSSSSQLGSCASNFGTVKLCICDRLAVATAR